jgi:hypothetical protein
VPPTDVGFVTVDIVMELQGTLWIKRGIQFTQTRPDGLRALSDVSRGTGTFTPVARIKRGGESYVSLYPYMLRTDSGPQSTHCRRLSDALSQAAEYLKEHSVFWNAFRHTA